MFRFEELVQPRLRDIKPYASARNEFGGNATISLDANESPWNESWNDKTPPLNRYPDPVQTELKKEIAKLKGVSPEQVFIGNGSDEAIDLLVRAVVRPGEDSVIIMPPTFGMYEISSFIQGANILKAPLTEDFQIDVPLVTSLFPAKAKILFICSPNNPTGNLLDEEVILSLVKTFPGVVLVDEAYIDFTERKSLVSRLNEFPNLVVNQTLSKAWGLAGARIGMLFGSSDIVSFLTKMKAPYNINSVSQQIAIDALKNADKKAEQVSTIISERKRVSEALKNCASVVHVYPSDANFLLVKTKDGNATYQALLTKGIVTRNRSSERRCENCLRVTIGTPEENNKLLEIWKTL